jgi:hypothetical protein
MKIRFLDFDKSPFKLHAGFGSKLVIYKTLQNRQSNLFNHKLLCKHYPILLPTVNTVAAAATTFGGQRKKFARLRWHGSLPPCTHLQHILYTRPATAVYLTTQAN